MNRIASSRIALLLGGLLLGGPLLGSLASCRGGISESPPLHPVLDMDFQQKIKAQTASDFEGFEDGRGMRLPPKGTVARLDVPVASSTGSGYRTLEELDALTTFKNGDDFVTENPVPRTEENVRRGQERFNVYCSVCHSKSGAGNGLVLQRAKAVAPGAFNYNVPDLGADAEVRKKPEGHFYNVISNGWNTMPAYGHQISVEDRWRIVHYLRVLQARFD